MRRVLDEFRPDLVHSMYYRYEQITVFGTCVPTKAVCGWLLGGIPVVCYSRYRGVVEWIDAWGIGFVVDSLKEVGTLKGRRDDIRRATRACLEQRQRIKHETQAARLHRYYRSLLV